MFIYYNSTFATGACLLAAMFGMGNLAYDASMINNLLLSEGYFEYFALTATWIGLNVAIVNVGNAVAGPFVGPLLDWTGRKKGLLIGNLLAIVGVFVSGFARNEATLLGGRLVLGLSFTITSVAATSLVAESTPASTHIVLTNCISIALPIFGTAVAVAMLAIYTSTSEWAWRGAILGELGAPIVSSICLLFSPESPRWLAQKGRNEEAFQVISRMHSMSDPARDAIIQAEFDQIVQTLRFEREAKQAGMNSWKSLVAHPADRRRFAIVVLINIFFQVSGSNTFPYFFSLVLTASGVTNVRTNLLVNIGLCIWGIVAVISGQFVCAWLGARRSLLLGTTIMTVCMALLALLTGLGHPDGSGGKGYGVGAIVVIFIFQLASFGTWMTLTYAYPPQIMRYTLRARGVALGQAIGYAFCVMMTYTLPMALENIGYRFYALNAAWNVGIIAVIYWLFVETKGKTLEELDADFDGTVHFEAGAVIGREVIVVLQGVNEKAIVHSTTSQEHGGEQKS